jgi:hypothetical protein
MRPGRLIRSAIVLRPSMLLSLHRALIQADAGTVCRGGPRTSECQQVSLAAPLSWAVSDADRGQWAPSFLILGFYNKLVKQLGSDPVSA